MTDLELARAERERLGLALVVARDSAVVTTGSRGGVADLLEILRRDGLETEGASLSDRVVGRAAAMLARCAGIAAVQGGVMSEPAVEALRDAGIPYSADRQVPHILNRSGDGMCPMERLCLDQTDPHTCREAIEAFVERMAPQRARS